MNIINYILARCIFSKQLQLILAGVGDYFDKCYLCDNINLSEETQLVLLNNNFIYVKISIVLNSNTSDKIKLMAIKIEGDDGRDIRWNLARCDNISEAIQLQLAKCNDVEVRRELVWNDIISETTKLILYKDDDREVRENCSIRDECYGVLYKLQYNVGLTKNASDALMENRIMKLQRESNNLIENVFKRLYTV